MEKAELIAVAIEEIEHPTFGVTEQFLEVHKVAYHDDKPVVAGVTIEVENNSATVYFSVKGEVFHLAVYLDIKPKIQVRGSDTEDFCQLYFHAYSEELNFKQLTSLTTLQTTGGYNLGDKLTFKASAVGSAVEFEVTPEPGAFDYKLKKLLTFLEQDVSGIKQLAEKANGGISVRAVFHNGTNMLGGFHLDKSDVKRLAALGLWIDFDLYAAGNFFK